MDIIPKSNSTNPNMGNYYYHHVVYCDGSCVNQHNVDHRWAGIRVYYVECDIRNKSLLLLGLRTELWAAILAVYLAILDSVSELEVRTDSL